MTLANITDGMVVAVHYVLTDDANVVLESTLDEQPLTYLHGAGNIPPRMESALSGLRQGDSVNVVLDPEDAYGTRVEEAVVRLPRTHFPPQANLEPGTQYSANGPDGNRYPIWIVSEEGDEVVVDFNHPLAGVRLHYELSVEAVRHGTPKEFEAGEPLEPAGEDQRG